MLQNSHVDSKQFIFVSLLWKAKNRLKRYKAFIEGCIGGIRNPTFHIRTFRNPLWWTYFHICIDNNPKGGTICGVKEMEQWN